MSQTDIARRLIKERQPKTVAEWSLLTGELMAVINTGRAKPISRSQARMIVKRALDVPRPRGGYHPPRGEGETQ